MAPETVSRIYLPQITATPPIPSHLRVPITNPVPGIIESPQIAPVTHKPAAIAFIDAVSFGQSLASKLARKSFALSTT